MWELLVIRSVFFFKNPFSRFLRLRRGAVGSIVVSPIEFLSTVILILESWSIPFNWGCIYSSFFVAHLGRSFWFDRYFQLLFEKKKKKKAQNLICWAYVPQSSKIFPEPNFRRLFRSMTLSIVQNIFSIGSLGWAMAGGQTSPFSVQNVVGHYNCCTTVQLCICGFSSVTFGHYNS